MSSSSSLYWRSVYFILLIYIGKLREGKNVVIDYVDTEDDDDGNIDVASTSTLGTSASVLLLNRALTQDVMTWLARGSGNSVDNSSGSSSNSNWNGSNDNIKTTFHLVSIDKRLLSRSPAQAFTTSSLQQEASKRLGLSPSQTMRLSQVSRYLVL